MKKSHCAGRWLQEERRRVEEAQRAAEDAASREKDATSRLDALQREADERVQQVRDECAKELREARSTLLLEHEVRGHVGEDFAIMWPALGTGCVGQGGEGAISGAAPKEAQVGALLRF